MEVEPVGYMELLLSEMNRGKVLLSTEPLSGVQLFIFAITCIHIQEWPIHSRYQKKIVIKKYQCSSFWLTKYLLCLIDVFFNRESTFLWVPTMLRLSRTCSFIRTIETSYWGFSRKAKKKLAGSYYLTFRLYRWCPFIK
jgi:hypothetical protein